MQEILRNTLRNILLALIRTLLRNGMSYGEFDQIARKCFVDVAFDDFATAGKKQTVSNVAILTGLNRKEVKKMHELDVDRSAVNSKQYNRIVRVLGGWINDPAFLRKDGNPRDLNYDGAGSFGELVKKYSGDMPVAAMQKALIASSNIKFTGDKKVRLLSHAYLPSDDPVEKLAILGTDTRQLIETIDFNLTAPKEALHFQRKASNPCVAVASIPKIKQFLRRRGQAFLEELDLYLSQHESDDESTAELSIGLFYHGPEIEEGEIEK
ncbi:MAG: hypothetical protein GY875_13365 [Gammaproteobacteria bacterium]|nr:hypothetical protein [Gammaproteobacteria bacterium]